MFRVPYWHPPVRIQAEVHRYLQVQARIRRMPRTLRVRDLRVLDGVLQREHLRVSPVKGMTAVAATITPAGLKGTGGPLRRRQGVDDNVNLAMMKDAKGREPAARGVIPEADLVRAHLPHQTIATVVTGVAVILTRDLYLALSLKTQTTV